MSRAAAGAESFLAAAGVDRAPWLAVGLAFGIASWFGLTTRFEWLAAILAGMGLAIAALGLLRGDGPHAHIRLALAGMALAFAVGTGLVWAKSALVGTPPIAGPVIADLTGRVLGREAQPAQGRVRLTLATRLEGAIRVRINVPQRLDDGRASEGALIRVKARLMPPAPPMIPGGLDFARNAWFSGLAATGTALGPVEIVAAGRGGVLQRAQHALGSHVRSRIAGSAGGVAAAFASGERGGIAESDEQAMRDAGLTHLLSISGLHVSAVIAAVYFLAIRLLALWPWLALRVRLPLVAAAAAAGAGVGYTLLTGAEVPTVRSCLGALLVLAAIALGREPLSLRLLALVAVAVMAMWPEAVVGPSFQLSFGSVLAIIAFHNAAPVRRFLAPRDEPWWAWLGRRAAMLLATGFVIELALTPIALFHFHRAGAYGALANVIAIPLTTFVAMPLIALALTFDLVGLGAPFWWLAGQSLNLLLELARWVAARPGAVTMFPTLGTAHFILFVLGGLWLGLWRGPVRLWGLVPALAGAAWLLLLRPPDLLISGDGHHVAMIEPGDERLLMLRDTRSSFARDTLGEVAGVRGEPLPLAQWPGARCNDDFCVVAIDRGGRRWTVLMARGKDAVGERALAAACDRVDIVIADRWLPRSCAPRWLKADRRLLDQTGGMAIDLDHRRVTIVAEEQGEQGWWRAHRPPWQ